MNHLESLAFAQSVLKTIARTVGKPCTLKICLIASDADEACVFHLHAPSHPSPYNSASTGIRTCPPIHIVTKNVHRLQSEFLAARLEACRVPNQRGDVSKRHPQGGVQHGIVQDTDTGSVTFF